MKFIGMPMGMWFLFGGSFRKHLVTDLGRTEEDAKENAKRAGKRYHEIIRKLPRFEKGDHFKMLTVNCALLSAFLLEMKEKPDFESAASWYRHAMMIGPMKWYCRRTERRRFSKKDYGDMKKTEALRAGEKNPYSWIMEFRPYPDGSGYETRFTGCGIMHLMTELGLPEYISVMCLLDYAMNEAGGRTRFERKHTMPNGAEFCDCGYSH